MSTGTDIPVVRGIGIHSRFGGAASASAAFRCGMSRISELPEWPYFDQTENEEHALTGSRAAGVGPGFQGTARLLKLGIEAIEDLKNTVDLAALDPSRLGVILVLAPQTEDEEPPPPELLDRLCSLSGLNVHKGNLHTTFGGRVGVVEAIRKAHLLLLEGKVDQVLLGSIDSLVTENVIRRLLDQQKIKTADNPVGFIPGEAACFVLIELLDRRSRSGDDKRQFSFQSMVVSEPSDLAPPQLGCALAEVAVNALRAACNEPIRKGTILADLNGTPSRAAVFGGAIVYMSQALGLDGWGQGFPATTFGETGAASSLLAICLAIRAFLRGYANSDRALILISCETGGHAALVIGTVD